MMAMGIAVKAIPMIRTRSRKESFWNMVVLLWSAFVEKTPAGRLRRKANSMLLTAAWPIVAPPADGPSRGLVGYPKSTGVSDWQCRPQ
jgi:hypothetical protein